MGVEFPKKINIREVGPRDGLQNEEKMIPLEAKVKWINMLSETGTPYIEVTSFVHPKWIPQLKDATEVSKLIKRNPNITYAALVPNLKGLRRALEVDIDEVCLFISASETHNKHNINRSISETLPILESVSKVAKKEGKTIRGYVSTVFGCPYEGDVDIGKVIEICDNLFKMGIDELSIGDTIGVANPEQVKRVILELMTHFPKDKIAMHFHNTRGTALANVLMALSLGITNFDSAVGGLGGCPYAEGASGNLATEDLLYMVHRMGIETGINENKIMEAALYIEEYVQNLSSHQMKILKRER